MDILGVVVDQESKGLVLIESDRGRIAARNAISGRAEVGSSVRATLTPGGGYYIASMTCN